MCISLAQYGQQIREHHICREINNPRGRTPEANLPQETWDSRAKHPDLRRAKHPVNETALKPHVPHQSRTCRLHEYNNGWVQSSHHSCQPQGIGGLQHYRKWSSLCSRWSSVRIGDCNNKAPGQTITTPCSWLLSTESALCGYHLSGACCSHLQPLRFYPPHITIQIWWAHGKLDGRGRECTSAPHLSPKTRILRMPGSAIPPSEVTQCFFSQDATSLLLPGNQVTARGGDQHFSARDNHHGMQSWAKGASEEIKKNKPRFASVCCVAQGWSMWSNCPRDWNQTCDWSAERSWEHATGGATTYRISKVYMHHLVTAGADCVQAHFWTPPATLPSLAGSCSKLSLGDKMLHSKFMSKTSFLSLVSVLAPESRRTLQEKLNSVCLFYSKLWVIKPMWRRWRPDASCFCFPPWWDCVFSLWQASFFFNS